MNFLDYLCPIEANVYGIEFTRFRLRDMDSGTVLFEVAKPPAGIGVTKFGFDHICICMYYVFHTLLIFASAMLVGIVGLITTH